MVGGLPASAERHRAWWSGDRPHVRAWRSAGYSIADLVPGEGVTFVRIAEPVQVARVPTEAGAAADLVLVTCVKEKVARPAAARDLYVSALFRKERAYAERQGVPWFILSAEHGLVAPTEWLAPYERYLPETPAAYRAAWGPWVVERLELLAGPLDGKVVEVHAGASYIDPLATHLAGKGAILRDPLHGMSMGKRLEWYGTAGAGSTWPAPPT